MTDTGTMSQLIRRESMAARLVEVLKQELHRFTRMQWLPGERILSRQFQVSRATLRAALIQLQRQKIIRAYPQRGYKILAIRPKGRGEPSRIIGCFQELSREGYKPHSQIMINAIEHGLNRAGYEMKMFTDIHLRGHARHQQLNSLVSDYHAAGWMLMTTSFKTQQWFMENRIPALILGSCHPGIKLPNLDVDYRAVCRHAVSFLWRLGHRHIYLLIRRSGLGGDIASEEGFQYALSQLGQETPPYRIVRHNGSTGDIRRVLDACLSRKPAPTAFLISRSEHTLTTLTYLLGRGIRVPGDISLICRDDNEFLEHVIPEMSRYAINRDAFARRCVRMLVQLSTAGYLKPCPRWMMPRCIRGATAAPPAN